MVQTLSLEKEFTITKDHKAFMSALKDYQSNKTYPSRLIRWVDRLQLYTFKKVRISVNDIGIIDCLSREPNGEQWSESELDEKLVVTKIEKLDKALDCLSNRINITGESTK